MHSIAARAFDGSGPRRAGAEGSVPETPAPGAATPDAGDQPNSPAWTPRTNACHSASVNTSAGPSGNLELRTATPSATRRAASTQLPLGLLKLLFRQAAARSSDARTPF